MKHNVTNHPQNCCEDEISLYDIWVKLVQHKKTFWSVFFITFVIGSAVVLLTPPKYTFSQVVELCRSLDEKGRNIINVYGTGDVGVGKKIKEVFYPQAMRAYNAQATNKFYISSRDLKVEDLGDRTLLLSMTGPLKNIDIYKFIFNKTVENLAVDSKGLVDSRKKILLDTKTGLERQLVETKEFYEILVKKHKDDSNKPRDSVENRLITMYVNGQNSSIIQLVGKINILQQQIIDTYNTHAASDFMISEQPVGPSKTVLFFLVAIVSLFLGLFGDVTGVNEYRSVLKNFIVENASIRGRYCVGVVIGQATGVEIFNVDVVKSEIHSDEDPGKIGGCVIINTHESISADDTVVYEKDVELKNDENRLFGVCVRCKKGEDDQKKTDKYN